MKSKSKKLSNKVKKDHDEVWKLYNELINSHKLGCSFSRTAIYEELAEQTGYSERQVQRILTEY